MTDFRFVANLRPETVESFEEVHYAPAAWLLSAHRLTPQTERLAVWVRERNEPLYADNGAKQLIERVAARFRGEAATIVRAALDERRANPLGARGDFSVSKALRRSAGALAAKVADAVDFEIEAQSLEDVTAAQLRMQPTHLFAAEDFTAGTLMKLNLDREITGWRIDHFRRRNRRTLELWERVASDPRCRSIKVFAVLSGVDYNTAFAAGEEAAARGALNIAYGFAGPNSDGRWVGSFQVGVRRIHLSAPAPRRYIRLVQVVRGIRDGMRKGGRNLRTFHGLGLGASAQFPVLLAALDARTSASVDSTSPLYDAVNDLVFYEEASGGDRITVTEGARSILDGGTWDFQCPFCTLIRRRFGHSPGKARSWWKEAGRPVVSDELLGLDKPLGLNLPVLATSRGPETSPMRRSRIGHNHWVLDVFARQAPERNRRAWALAAIDQIDQSRTFSTRAGLRGARETLETLL